MQDNNNFYWKQQPLQPNIMNPTRKIVHPSINVVGIIYVQDIHKNVCNRIQ